MTVQGFRISRDVAIVALPGEVFVGSKWARASAMRPRGESASFKVAR